MYFVVERMKAPENKTKKEKCVKRHLFKTYFLGLKNSTYAAPPVTATKMSPTISHFIGIGLIFVI
jgi:hypothetical protein